MKRIVAGSLLPDNKMVKLHDILFDIGQAWFSVAMIIVFLHESLEGWKPWTPQQRCHTADVLKVPFLLAWPWLLKLPVCFASLLSKPSDFSQGEDNPLSYTICTLKLWRVLQVFLASSPEMEIVLGNSKHSLGWTISMLFWKSFNFSVLCNFVASCLLLPWLIVSLQWLQ